MSWAFIIVPLAKIPPDLAHDSIVYCGEYMLIGGGWKGLLFGESVFGDCAIARTLLGGYGGLSK